jgi:hypothetical protein
MKFLENAEKLMAAPSTAPTKAGVVVLVSV